MKETLLQKEMKKIDWIVPWLSGGEEDEAMKLALEVTARLEAEAAEDEAIKQAEIARVLAETQAVEEAEFNATTGTFSGRYGKNVTLDEEGMNQVESILNQKKSDIQKIVSEYND